jgi:hypothetical protein
VYSMAPACPTARARARGGGGGGAGGGGGPPPGPPPRAPPPPPPAPPPRARTHTTTHPPTHTGLLCALLPVPMLDCQRSGFAKCAFSPLPHFAPPVPAPVSAPMHLVLSNRLM